MALTDLLVAGIESRVRGMIVYLVRKGVSLDDHTLAARAALETQTNMSMRDPVDIALTQRIAEEQVSVVRTSSMMQRGQIQGTAGEIPKTTTFPPNATGQYRYVVVVKIKDVNSGATLESLQEIYSDHPMDPDTVREVAIINSRIFNSNDTITGAAGMEVNWGQPRATIISVSQRQ